MDTLLPGINAERVPTSLADRQRARDGRTSRRDIFVESMLSTRVVIEDAGHGPHLDQPERFLAELTDHLASR